MNTEYNKSTIKLKKLEKEMFSNIEKTGGLVKPFYNTLVQAICKHLYFNYTLQKKL